MLSNSKLIFVAIKMNFKNYKLKNETNTSDFSCRNG